ncbi:hypothetical protein AWC38_SpisGene652 [Stylophora pistillata]|uniref:Uncharacterized protein n=1 Tax=Stylophora pistillata TaxID=50429 RepID=A0A2B4T0R3_STYPI|nr:hypothetical protein AWC38_SpisGene652 [Stylophora pistillata]
MTFLRARLEHVFSNGGRFLDDFEAVKIGHRSRDLEHNDLIENFTKFLNDEENRRHLKLLRPMSGGEAVQVKVGIHIVYIGKFRESDMKFRYPEEISSPERTSSEAFPNLRPAADVENKASISWAQEDLTVTENESSTLDKWSRYIFLPTFIILNVVFWVYYLVLDDNNF